MCAFGTNSTVYGLYRDGTELRGVYYDKPDVAHAACDSTDACDYPILLGNDPLYGGLGGEFTSVSAYFICFVHFSSFPFFPLLFKKSFSGHGY